MTGEPETMTVEQISERFGVKSQTLRLWYRKKVIKGSKFPNSKLILIDVKSFRDYLQKYANS